MCSGKKKVPPRVTRVLVVQGKGGSVASGTGADRPSSRRHLSVISIALKVHVRKKKLRNEKKNTERENLIKGCEKNSEFFLAYLSSDNFSKNWKL